MKSHNRSLVEYRNRVLTVEGIAIVQSSWAASRCSRAPDGWGGHAGTGAEGGWAGWRRCAGFAAAAGHVGPRTVPAGGARAALAQQGPRVGRRQGLGGRAGGGSGTWPARPREAAIPIYLSSRNINKLSTFKVHLDPIIYYKYI